MTNKKTVQDLVVALDLMRVTMLTNRKIMDASAESDFITDYAYSFPDLEKEIDEIKNMCDYLLILPNGQADHHRHKLFKELSKGLYFITCGEKDQHGWLTGVINTPNGKIVYG